MEIQSTKLFFVDIQSTYICTICYRTFLFEIFWVSPRIINLKVMETSTRSKPAKISAILIHHVLLIAVDNFNSEMSRLALYLFSREQLFIVLF